MTNLAVPWPAKDPLADLDCYFGCDAAGNYWRAKADNVHKQILRRFHPLRPSGTWSPGDVIGQLSTSSGLNSTTKTWFAPFRKYRPEVIDRLATVQGSGAGSGNIALAIYASDNSIARPTGTSPLAYTGSIACPNVAAGDCIGSFAGGTGLSGGNFPFDLGIYWYAVQTSASLSFIKNSPFTSVGSLMAWIFGGDTLDEIEGGASAGSYNGVNCASTFGTWPNATTATWSKTVGSDASRFLTPFWRIA